MSPPTCETDAAPQLARKARLAGARCIVAIPVRNERDRIVSCLDALARQIDVPHSCFGILLFLNNCTDGTRQTIEGWTPSSPWTVRLIEQDSTSASAGWARRQAMDAGAAWLSEDGSTDGLLMTTDADSHVPNDWVARNRAAIAAGADAVAGRIAFDPLEILTLPIGIRQRQRREVEYESLLAEIQARLAPQRGNPWPCHWMKSGASIAVRLDAYRMVGGIPLRPSGEDHAFIDLLGAHGFVVRHAADIVVMTSGRLQGRAQGGTAETLQRWQRDLGSPCDARLQRVGAFVCQILAGRTFAERKNRSPLLPRDLPSQIRTARLLLTLLRWREGYRAGRHHAGSLTPDAPKPLMTP